MTGAERAGSCSKRMARPRTQKGRAATIRVAMRDVNSSPTATMTTDAGVDRSMAPESGRTTIAMPAIMRQRRCS